MLETKVVLNIIGGLHARPATHLVKIASRFQSKIIMSAEGVEVDAKSIMGVMAIGATKGTELTVQVEGEDAEAALVAIVELFESNFNEE